MSFFYRGLFALTLITIFHTSLQAKYLYKDEIIDNKDFTRQVELLGKSLYEKTGISLMLIMKKELPQNITMYEYEQKLLKEFNKPTILLTFSEMNSQIDIEANEKSLYKYFNKKQVLSPVTSIAQAFIMSAFYAKSFSEFKDMIGNTGGSILPLLGAKVKKNKILNKYSMAMFNGYLDIAQQIAKAKNIELGHGFDSQSNQQTMVLIKILFYSFILYSIFMLIKRKIYRMRHKDEKRKQW